MLVLKQSIFRLLIALLCGFETETNGPISFYTSRPVIHWAFTKFPPRSMYMCNTTEKECSGGYTVGSLAE